MRNYTLRRHTGTRAICLPQRTLPQSTKPQTATSPATPAVIVISIDTIPICTRTTRHQTAR